MQLHIYRAPSGQWSGKILDDNGEEQAGIAGCESPEEVEEAAISNPLYDIDNIIRD